MQETKSRTVTAVPETELLSCRYSFQPTNDKTAIELFHICHLVSESLYEGGGMWVESASDPYPPMVRQVSRRVIGYLGAFRKTGCAAYRQRALEGLGYLLDEQRDSGEYAWYRNSIHGVCNRNDGLYEAGIAGVALLEGYAEFMDDRFFAASEKTAKWSLECPVSPNYNYNMFAVWHLARHFLVSGDRRCLDGAVEKSESTVRDQLPNGRWRGHNSWIWYHSIILLGLSELYRALPADDPYRKKLLACMTRAVNRIVLDQQPNGSVPPNPDEDEYDPVIPVVNAHRNAFALQALCSVATYTPLDVGNLVNGLMQYRRSTEITKEYAASLGGFSAVRGSWADRHRHSGRRSPTEEANLAVPGETLVWNEDFLRLGLPGKWGQVPEGWFVCWLPSREPEPGHIQFGLAGGGNGLQYTAKHWGLNGIGYDLGAGGIRLEPGHRYRLCCKFRVTASAAAGKLSCLILSSYSGKPRDRWNMIEGCGYAVCSPILDEYFDFVHWIIATGEDRYIYLSMDVAALCGQGEITVEIGNVHLVDEGFPGAVPCGKLPYDDYECSVMALGGYLDT